jgi:hypothetical protein
MSEVHFEVLPGLTSKFASGDNKRSLRFHVSIERDETLGAILRRLCREGHDLGRVIYDAEAHKLRPGVEVLINRRILSPEAAITTSLGQDDHVAFVPVYAGG